MTSTCEGCGRRVAVGPDHPTPFVCPDARPGDDIDHVLVVDPVPLEVDAATDATFLRFRRSLAFGRLPLDDDAVCDLVRRLDPGFVVTPATDHDLLGVRLTVKDETGNVAGCHKGRHLMGLLLWLEAVEALGWLEPGRPLAIASCGNAALAAAVLARHAGRALDVYIPEAADPRVVTRLQELSARIHRCERREGERGDPTWLRFGEAVAAGALPFCCQGPANGLTLDGGRTLAFELAGREVDHVVLQVGGGALASSFVRGLEDLPTSPRIHLVQTEVVSPLARAVDLVRAHGSDLDWACTHRSAVMWPWELDGAPHSVADAILDDETYDWHRLVRAVLETGGEAVTVSEATLIEGRERLEQATGIRASATGAAGLAGLLHLRGEGVVEPGARVWVVATGAARAG